jgi:tetratricopeptide (TPR) repeat protein
MRQRSVANGGQLPKNHRKTSGSSPNSSARTINERRVTTPIAIHEAGLAHMPGGRYRDARLCRQQALAADPNHADALHLMGLLSLQAKQYNHAVEWIARAIR